MRKQATIPTLGRKRQDGHNFEPVWFTYQGPGQPGLQSNILLNTKSKDKTVLVLSVAVDIRQNCGNYTPLRQPQFIPREVKGLPSV